MKKHLEFIKDEKVMTICVSENGNPWCAPVYYIFDNRFYFFSSKGSIHIQHGLNKKVSCSIYSDGDKTSDIKGLQMRGLIEIPGVIESNNAILKYLKKFRKFIPEHINSMESLEVFFKSKLYSFVPDEMVFTDNSSGFGKKIKIDTGGL